MKPPLYIPESAPALKRSSRFRPPARDRPHRRRIWRLPGHVTLEDLLEAWSATAEPGQEGEPAVAQRATSWLVDGMLRSTS